MLQYGDALGLFQNGCNLVGKFRALLTDGPSLPVAFAAPLTQQKPPIGRVGIEECLTGNKSRCYVGAVHCFARKLFVSGSHAVGDAAFNKYVDHDNLICGLCEFIWDYTIFFLHQRPCKDIRC